MAVTLASSTFTIATVFIASVVWNIIKQLYFKDANQPPVVFHWLPLVGSTVSYGKDPYQFFFDCRKKVTLWIASVYIAHTLTFAVRGLFHFHPARKEDNRLSG